MTDAIYANRLLAIDDEAAVCRIIERTAQSAGFDVVVTENPEFFMRLLRSWHPTVIILDLKIPKMDGVELLRALAADNCAAEVIIASGSDTRVLDIAMNLGRERGLKVSGCLQKPIRAGKLQQILQQFRKIPTDVLVLELDQALTTGELFLEYQPKFDYIQGMFTSVEALVRWRHPDRGILCPDQFIQLAEQSGAIQPLTDRVMAMAARQAAAWRAQNISLDISVNISAKDVEDLELPERLQQHCLDAAIDPSLIVLEITETSAMREAVEILDVLTRVRLKGFKLSIDDLGVGYSSLIKLQRLPFSEIKIDRFFVMNMVKNRSCQIIVEMLLDMARKLGLHTVGEGVEDEATLEALFERGCGMAQGYYLARPMAAAETSSFIRQRNSSGARLMATGG